MQDPAPGIPDHRAPEHCFNITDYEIIPNWYFAAYRMASQYKELLQHTER